MRTSLCEQIGGFYMEQKIILNDSIYENEFLESSNLIDDFSELRKIEQICAEFNFDVLRKQFDLSHKETDFKYIVGNFLILSDRLDGMACKLGSFISEKTRGRVLGVISSKGELEKDMLDIDYLIIVGYLKDESNFEIIDEIRAKNHRMNVIFYATFSSITKRQMNEYGVNCIFERHESLVSLLRLF